MDADSGAGSGICPEPPPDPPPDSGPSTEDRQALPYRCHQCKAVSTRGQRGRPLKLKTRSQLAQEQQTQEPSAEDVTSPTSIKSEGDGEGGMATASSPPPIKWEDAPPINVSGASADGGGGRGHLMRGATTMGFADQAVLRASPMIPEFTYAQRMVQTAFAYFPQMKAEGRVDDAMVLMTIKMWWLYNHRHKADISLGLCDMLLKVVGPHVMALASPPRDPNLETNPDVSAMSISYLPRYIKELDDRYTAVTITAFRDSEFQNYCNRRFEENFMTAEEFDYRVRQCQMLPVLVWASILHPDDLESFSAKMTDFWFSKPLVNKEMSCICKCVDKRGRQMLCLIRVRLIMMQGFCTAVMCVIELPPSRYWRPLPADSPFLIPRLQQQQQEPISSPDRPPQGDGVTLPPWMLPWASSSSQQQQQQPQVKIEIDRTDGERRQSAPPPRRPPPQPSILPPAALDGVSNLFPSPRDDGGGASMSQEARPSSSTNTSDGGWAHSIFWQDEPTATSSSPSEKKAKTKPDG